MAGLKQHYSTMSVHYLLGKTGTHGYHTDKESDNSH